MPCTIRLFIIAIICSGVPSILQAQPPVRDNNYSNSKRPEQARIYKDSFFEKIISDALDYHTVPRAVSLASINNDINKSAELLAQYEFQLKENDKQTGWQWFDSTYQSLKQRNEFLTQSFGYVILIKKSLLSEDGAEALNKIKYYTAELVNTQYAGYGALYFALNKLSAHPQYKSFAAGKAAEIAAYARQDAKAQHFLTADIEKDMPDAPDAQKAMATRNKFNAEFIPKIEALAIKINGC